MLCAGAFACGVLCILGRLHCLLRGSLIEQSLVDVQRLFSPLVHSYLSSGAPPEAGGLEGKTRWGPPYLQYGSESEVLRFQWRLLSMKI